MAFDNITREVSSSLSRYRKYDGRLSFEYSDLGNSERSLSSLSYVFVDKDDDLVQEFACRGCSSMVAVKASKKLKEVDYASTFIAFSDSIERLASVTNANPHPDDVQEFDAYLYSDTPLKS